MDECMWEGISLMNPCDAVSQSVFYHVLNVVSGEWCLKEMFYGEIIFI